ncbi:STAS domain-containing protein [Streptomyces bauhiniae]|uniref:STAS domain-containing protein n=1 Tax=Streptomyces bauhiniae TaxID=2340725 RepID=A0A7K3QW93_9ACTN|nr:STAS domain-containing protein [Streptomyces bauhiniae]NEB94184.1 STAS domain-containing protein [Streptomyces bauhiniae]
MTLHQPAGFSVTVEAAEPRTIRLTLQGVLDFESGDEFLDVVGSTLDAHAVEHGPVLRELHMNCAGLRLLDSTGLSALLTLRRRTHPAGITLHLRHRPVQLIRMLALTGTAEYLTARADGTAETVGPGGELADEAESTSS